MLARRLARRGVTLSAGALTLALAQASASASVPAPLVGATVKAGTLLATGNAAKTALIAAQVVSLTNSVLKAMYLGKLNLVAGILLAMALFGLGVQALTHQAPATEDAAAPPAPVVNPRQPKDQPANPVTAAVTKAVTFLKAAQKDGNWEHHFPAGHKGGVTSLALLALLESGVKPDEEAVRKALDYLRTVEPKQTYVVSLQTMAFCKSGRKADRALIQRNVDALLKFRVRRNDEFVGWSYGPGHGPRADNSNTQFAVMALHAASQAGIKIDAKVWKEIQDYYLRSQQETGGWGYAPIANSGPTLTMTCAGVCGLLIARQHLPQRVEGEDIALAKGLEFVGDHFSVTANVHAYYRLYGGARTGALSGKAVFIGKDKNLRRDWYGRGLSFLLEGQAEDGAWRGGPPEQDPVIATSFALLFLAQGRR
jgi:hypothetical protein